MQDIKDIKEYWINVYDFTNADNVIKKEYEKDIKAGYYYNEVPVINWGLCLQVPLYRIHVKMKPKEIIVSHPSEIPKDLPIGTKVRIVAPKWAYDIHESWKWL